MSVWKAMKRLEIKGYVRKGRYPSRPGNEHSDIPNVLGREFCADAPLQKIVSDVTHIKHKGKWFFLVCYLDLFNNEIVEWELSQSFDNMFVIRAAEKLLEKAASAERTILLHSDQGTQLLREYGAIQSMSRAGTKKDNAVIESLLRTI